MTIVSDTNASLTIQLIPEADEAQLAVQAVDRLFMERFNAGEVEAAALGVYSADATLLPPGGAIVRGRTAIAQFWAATVQQMGIEGVELSTLAFERSGDVAHQIGRAILTLAGGARTEAKYVVVWKQEDGAWKWHVDIWNGNG